MSNRMKASFGVYILAAIILATFSSIYLFRSEFMPYHADAVGMSWDNVPQGFQITILALMKTLGGGWLAIFVGFAAILFIPFRKGELWAKYTLLFMALACLIPSLYSNILYIKANIGAEPPWILIVITIVLNLTGFFLSLSKE